MARRSKAAQAAEDKAAQANAGVEAVETKAAEVKTEQAPKQEKTVVKNTKEVI